MGSAPHTAGNYETVEPTLSLRWLGKFGTTTEAPRLQQKCLVKWWDASGRALWERVEWRDVPRAFEE